MASIRPVTLIEIENPFQPEQRKEHVLVPHPQDSVSDALARVGLKADDCAISVNGQIIESAEAAFHLAMPGDTVMACAGAGNGVLKVIGQLALVASAIAAELILGPVVGSLVASAILTGGNMLLSAFFSPSLGSANQASFTYDPTGPKTLAQPGVPIPKGYGSMGWGGNIISSFVDQDGKDQYVNCLVCFGFGRAKSLTKIFVNQKPITAFRDLTYAVRLGTNSQSPIPGFSQIRNTYGQQIELLAAQPPVVVPGTGNNTSGLQVAVKFPGGLMRVDDKGDPKEVSFAYKIEISPGGQNQWTTPIFPRTTHDVKTTDTNGFQHYPHWVVIPTDRFAGSGIVYSTDTDAGAHYEGEPWEHSQSVKVYNIDNSNSTYSQQFQGEWHAMDVNEQLESVTDWWGGYRIVSDMTNSSFYDVTNIYGLQPGVWDVRLTKYGAGPHNQPIPAGDGYMTNPHYTADGWLWDVTEIQLEDLAYPNMILLGIRALATDQLSGANINITATIEHDIGEDTVLPPELAGYATDNPAVVLYDIQANPLYGMNSADKADLYDLVNLANFCDQPVPTQTGGTQRRFRFAGVYDATGNAWSALQQCAQMARAQVIQTGTKYGVVIDAPADVAQVFNETNIRRGSITESFVAFEDRANCIECEFADATRNYRTDLPVSVMSANTINSGVQPKIVRTKLLGCTNRDQAWAWSYFHLLSTDTLLRSIKFSANVDAVACRMGSVIGVQLSKWGTGGRVMAGSGITALQTDSTDIPAYSPAQGWTVAVVHPTLKRGQAVIQGVSLAARTLTLSMMPSGRILRVTGVAGAETAVRGTGGNVLQVDSVHGFNIGDTVTLWDTSVLDAQLVSSVNGSTIVPTAPFLQAPAEDAVWAYGQSYGAAPVKLYRVTGLRQSGDLQIEISGIEYNPAIYTDVIPAYDASGAPVVNAAVSNVTVKEQYQRTVTITKSTQAVLAVNYDRGPNTASTLVYGSVDGSQERFLGKGSADGYTMSASQGDVWVLRVVGVDPKGNPAPHSTAPTITYTVAGASNAPADVKNIVGNYNPGILGLTWDNTVGQSYEIRYTADPNNNDWSKGTVLYTNLIQGDGNPRAGQNIGNPGPGLYMVKAISGAYYSLNPASYYLTFGSSQLNAQGSIAPGQVVLASASISGTSATITCPSQTLSRSDGTALLVYPTTLSYTGLAPSTTYYIYTYIATATGTMGAVKGPGATPDTAPTPASALAAALDGRIPGPILIITTGTSSGGGSYSGGGPGTCPDSREMVNVFMRGDIPCADVKVGDELLGWSFTQQCLVYRRVVAVRHAEAFAWHRVDGYRISPIDPVWREGRWQMPYAIGAADHGAGMRVKIEVEADDYDAHNYYLVGRRETLLIHNIQVGAC